MIPEQLFRFVLVGGVVGVFFGGFWQGVGAMALVWIGKRFDEYVKSQEQQKAAAALPEDE
ncbi:hypothetical protein [Salisediminibacterium halotolerans]|uniref:Uncharacterized protein n=1 Tax=Salisediminibacterium halotolerans TaxID=517425 RepID=A0A1H9W920_9BACI|nr:hypothetical protein [Salisediminibacterium haloalkalitolerans]SES30412.1 hypothetical protein SAMN05444126_1302 [Salisediminibacterium haloalkalitolerans]